MERASKVGLRLWRAASLHWWRIAVVAGLCWIGYELHQVRREMPGGGLAFDTEQQIRAISLLAEQMRAALVEIERNTRR